MSEDTASGQVPFQDSRSNSSQAYLKRAASAVAEGDSVLGIHLYLAAYERALRESIMPGEEVLEGMSKAWDLAIKTKQRSLAEYIFEKLEPYWDSNEVSRHADELQRLAFDKLEEYGFDRDAIEGMADMVNQDLMDAAPDMLCRFEESAPAASPASAPAEDPQAAAGSAQNASGSAEANQSSADANREQAVKDLTSLIFGQTSEAKAEPAVPEQRFDYRSLVGFGNAIATMGELGVGRSRDPEFARFVAMLNARHGLPGIPRLGTLLFRCPAREDSNYFMVATAGELNMPAIRMRLDQNAQGQAVLCVMASADFKSRISGVPRAGFESPTVVILEDFDLFRNLPRIPCRAFFRCSCPVAPVKHWHLSRQPLKAPRQRFSFPHPSQAISIRFSGNLSGLSIRSLISNFPAHVSVVRFGEKSRRSILLLEAWMLLVWWSSLVAFLVLRSLPLQVRRSRRLIGRALPKIASAQLRPARWFRVWRTSSHWILRSIAAWRIWRLKSCAGVLPISTICWRTNG